MGAKPETPSSTQRDRVVLVVALLALVVKLCIAWNTIGTNDTVTFFDFARHLQEKGLAETYRWTALFNHPPLTAYYLELIVWLHNLAGAPSQTFRFLLRLPGIVSDFATVFVILQITKREPRLRPPLWALLLFAASPVSIMVSGFHGNTDSVVVFLLVLATLMLLRDNPAMCGVFLALSCQIKVVPLLLTPVFFFFWFYRQRSARFVLPFTLTWLLLCLQPLIQCPTVYITNVLSYGSYWGLWGASYLLRLTQLPQFQKISSFGLTPAQVIIAACLKLVIIGGVLSIAWRRRVLPANHIWESLACAWAIFFVFSPGVGPQYMVWSAPFVLLWSARWYAALTVASAFFLFTFYDAIADGLPWYYARSVNQLVHLWAPSSLVPWLTLIAMVFFFRWKTVGPTDEPRLRSLGTPAFEDSD